MRYASASWPWATTAFCTLKLSANLAELGAERSGKKQSFIRALSALLIALSRWQRRILPTRSSGMAFDCQGAQQQGASDDHGGGFSMVKLSVSMQKGNPSFEICYSDAPSRCFTPSTFSGTSTHRRMTKKRCADFGMGKTSAICLS